MHRGDYLSHGTRFIPTGQGWLYPNQTLPDLCFGENLAKT